VAAAQVELEQVGGLAVRLGAVVGVADEVGARVDEDAAGELGLSRRMASNSATTWPSSASSMVTSDSVG
jgi:hypothetical protein